MSTPGGLRAAANDPSSAKNHPVAQDFEKIARGEAARAILNYDAERTLRALSAKKRKSPSILVLGRDGFSDNSKYLYLALLSKSLDIPVYWGTFDSKLHAELIAGICPPST